IEKTEGCSAVCVSTPLADKDTKRALTGASSHTCVILPRGSRCAAILTWFVTEGYTPFRSITPCEVSAVSGEGFMTTDGVWRKLGSEPIASAGGNYICRDLSEFGPSNPFVTYISDTEYELPVIVFSDGSTDISEIDCGSMKVGLSGGSSSLGLAHIAGCGRFDSVSYRPAAPVPLFSILLRDLAGEKNLMLSSLSVWDSVGRSDENGSVCFRFVRQDARVTLTAIPGIASNSIAWEADVRLYDRNLSVVRFDPPYAGMNISAGSKTKIFFALGPGQTIPVDEYTIYHSMSPYPSIGVCMQYLAFYDDLSRRGIYCGYHDPAGEYKLLHADCQNGVCSCGALIPAKGIDEPKNGFSMSGSVVWQLFDGDWYDAALIYRDFVEKEAHWFTGVMAKNRSDVPKWLLEMPAWLRTDVNHDGWMDSLFKAADEIGDLPLGVHAYQWHKIPFDTNYPHYRPAREDFTEKLPVIQARGIKVMPYINGRLWDTHDRGDYDYQFTSVAKPWAAKGRNGAVITESYASKNSRGEPVELAVMCPSSALWQEKQSEINDWILNGLGADAVYVDQIAAAPPVCCMDKSHAHRPGGGSWWYEHYYNLIQHLNLKAGSGKCYTTESNAETFVGHIGGMLVWHWGGANQVPAFPVIYSRYQPMLGRNYGAIKPDDALSFRVLTAQSLCFGDQPGWMTPELLLQNPSKEFFYKVASLRWRYRDYYISGTCLRPPKLTGETGERELPFASDAVISAMWRSESGGFLIIVVNISDRARSVTAHPDGMEEFAVDLSPETVFIKEIK
ncbi:MAG: DUF6259 domain-containing protein, partial [Clostridiales bacterium]|nr:DUF6259 domain-containing protein [Clostridiales bacterium]